MRPRIVVFAYHDIGYSCLETLITGGENVVAVVTYDDNPDENIWFKSVEQLALENGIPVLKPENVKSPEFIRTIRHHRPDIIFSFYFRHIIPAAILDMPFLGAMNMHGSLLPAYRGRSPVNWVLVNGEKETGMTLHYMVEKPDRGDIILQRTVPVDFEDTAVTLFKKMERAAVEVLDEALPLIKDGRVVPIPQDPSKASYFGGRGPEDGLIDWKKSGLEIYNLVRAVTDPYPGAFTFLRGKKLMVWKSRPVERPSFSGASAPPGTVIGLAPGGAPIVQAGKGCLRLDDYSLEGRKGIDIKTGDILTAGPTSQETRC